MLEVERIRRDPGLRFEGQEEVVILLMCLRFPDLQERTCPLNIDTVVDLVSADERKEYSMIVVAEMPKVRIHGVCRS